MFQEDLSAYRYDRNDENGKAISIGWLAASVPFTLGDAPEGLVERLRSIPVTNLYRGSHTCEFCSRESGNGDLRVAGLDGVVYVAPKLITHYIEAHRYLPPKEFIEAVATMPGIQSYAGGK